MSMIDGESANDLNDRAAFAEFMLQCERECKVEGKEFNLEDFNHKLSTFFT